MPFFFGESTMQELKREYYGNGTLENGKSIRRLKHTDGFLKLSTTDADESTERMAIPCVESYDSTIGNVALCTVRENLALCSALVKNYVLEQSLMNDDDTRSRRTDIKGLTEMILRFLNTVYNDVDNFK